MNKNEDLDALIKLIVKKINFSSSKSNQQAEKRASVVNDFIIEVLKEFSKESGKENREKLNKFFGLKSINGILYDKKMTSSHLINALMLIWNCKTPEELIEKIVSDTLNKRNTKLRKSDVEWIRLDDTLDEDEKMYLIYCAKKYKQLKASRTKSK